MAYYTVTYQRKVTGKIGSARWRSREFPSLPEAYDFIERNNFPLWSLNHVGYVPELEEYEDINLGDRLLRFPYSKGKVSTNWTPSLMKEVDESFYSTYIQPREKLIELGFSKGKVKKFLKELQEKD